jgi:lambda repressor-like predicted transcriptional regulator
MALNQRIPIEDNYADVLTKAAVGQRLGHSALAERSGLDIAAVRSLFSENYDPKHARTIAALLGLDPERVAAMAESDWYPQVDEVSGLVCFNTPFPQAGYAGASANNYLIYSHRTREAVVFDTGVNSVALLEYIEAKHCR